MKTMTYTESRARYAEVLDQVVNDREEIVITSKTYGRSREDDGRRDDALAARTR